jgi:signal peptide peptidase-like protein 2B
MAFSLCIYFLCVIRMPNIKVASALLILAFLYDIFWVFLSPYLFSSSVMVTVATGGDHEPRGGGDDEIPCNPEPIPMLFKIPHMYKGGGRNYSLLGLGDVVLPGLLVAFCLRYDYHAQNSWRKGYFVPVYIGYCIGLGMANAAVILTGLGQPALLYLVPCTLGPLCCLGWRDGTFKALWKGPFDEDNRHSELEERLSDSPASEDSCEHDSSFSSHNARVSDDHLGPLVQGRMSAHSD